MESERLGHSKIGITLDLYSHVLPGMEADAAEPIGGTPEQFGDYIRSEIVKYAKVVKESGAKID